MLLCSTPPFSRCSHLHTVKGSNESSSFPLLLCFLFNYSQAVPVLLYFSPPYAALFSWGFLFWTVPLAPLPFLSPQHVPPALLWSAAFVTSTCTYAGSPSFPWLLVCRVSLCFTPMFLPGGQQPASKETILLWPLLMLSCCQLLSANQGETVLLPLHSWLVVKARTALQLLSNWELLLCSPTERQGTAQHLLNSAHSGPLGWKARLSGAAGALPAVLTKINQDEDPWLQIRQQTQQCQGQSCLSFVP